ncbi:2-amino-4-hydroxy-6-hydroxymethyldihydropteridine diphosphokinase [Singulisphaera rosea]
MNTNAFIGLGSNLGERRAFLEAAIEGLAASGQVTVHAVSQFIETPSVGGPGGQGFYLNAAAALQTELDAPALLRLLQSLEKQAGRIRTVRWGERPIDLDLLLFDQQIIETGAMNLGNDADPSLSLIVPHPRMAVRRFVLAPLAEIAAEAVDPLTCRTIRELLINLDRRPSNLALFGFPKAFAVELLPHLSRQLEAEIVPVGYDPTPESRERQSLADRVRAFESRCEGLNLDRWAKSTEEQRWILSDFWFDAEVAELRRGTEGLLSRDRVEFYRRRMLTPTFVVAPASSRRLFARASSYWNGLDALGDTPILEVDPEGDPIAVAAEILAACDASRVGR